MSSFPREWFEVRSTRGQERSPPPPVHLRPSVMADPTRLDRQSISQTQTLTS